MEDDAGVPDGAGHWLDESRYRALLDVVPASVFALTEDLQLEYVNRYWTEYSGLSLDESQTLPASVLHPDDLTRVLAEAPARFRRGEPFTLEYRARRADGEYRWHLSHTLPAHDKSGGVLGWVGASIDIDDRKRAEEGQAFLWSAGQALSESLDYERTLNKVAGLCVPYLGEGCAIDVIDGDVLVPAGLSHVDSAKERIGREIRERFPPSVESAHPSALAIRSGGPVVTEVQREVLRTIARDEEHLDLVEALEASVALTVPLVGHGPPVGAITFIRKEPVRFSPAEVQLAMDVGRRAGMAVENARLFREAQQTSEELRLANAAKDEFLGLVSHELRTPLTTISGNADILLRRSEDLPAEVKLRALSDIRRDAERLQRLVENMLALSQVETEGTVAPEPMLLQRSLPRLIAAHRRIAPGRQVTLEVEAGLPPVLAHPTYFDQIMENLLSNAEKYSPADSPVDVRALRTDGGATVIVADRGAGISEAEAEAVFAPFFRTEQAKGKAGLGLGLAVCKRLVEAQGGTIWARPREGGGTEMGFTLRLEGTAAAKGSR